jgi:hypothetical protein
MTHDHEGPDCAHFAAMKGPRGYEGESGWCSCHPEARYRAFHADSSDPCIPIPEDGRPVEITRGEVAA